MNSDKLGLVLRSCCFKVVSENVFLLNNDAEIRLIDFQV